MSSNNANPVAVRFCRFRSPYEWDFDGQCAPHRGGLATHRTFTLAIFQWIPRASGRGLKRGKAVMRIKGCVDHPNEAYASAKAEVKRRNAEEVKHRA